MFRRVRNPIVSLSLVAAGAVVALGTGAVIVPADDAPATSPHAAAPETSASTSVAAEPTTTIPSPTTTVAPTTRPTTTTTMPDGPEVESVASAGPTDGPLVPTRVRIDKIGVDASMIDLYKQADNTLQVPEDVRLTGWYTGRSVPGEPGPSVVVGHVDSAAQGPGVFYRLSELVRGDVVQIDRSDGSVATFRVTGSELVLKTEFPTERVYGSVEGSKLRLITCGGAFNGATHHYEGNWIIYADLVESADAAATRPNGWQS